MTDPIIPFINQLEEKRTKGGIVPKGPKNIISSTYHDESVFKMFYFFEHESDFDMFKSLILSRNVSVSLSARQVKSSGKMFDPGFILIVTPPEEGYEFLKTPIDNTDTFAAWKSSLIGEEIDQIFDDLGHTRTHSGQMVKHEYIKLGEP
tara:strand:- start:79 stop:525 length:447 start_codon:yes stop_codon:yes gene_type:complete